MSLEPVSEFEPFTLIDQLAPIPVVVAVPHAGRAYSPEVLAAMRQPDAARLRLEDRHADTLGREIARHVRVPLLVANAPRAVIDLNRAGDDIDWGMIAGGRGRAGARHSAANRRARSGLGLVPRRLSGMGEIWRHTLPYEELERRIETIHRPYHAKLGATLEQMRDAWGAVLLVDLHSMPPLAQRFDDEPAPEFVIGDRFGSSCAAAIAARAVRFLGSQARLVAHNRPYSGGYVLDRHGNPARGIHALQIEVCRTAYLDAAMAEPTARIGPLGRLLADLIRTLAAEIADMGRGGPTSLAAE